MAGMKKPKTEAQKDRAKDQRLQKVYGISLYEYNALLAKSNGKCKICGNPPGTIRLSTDHDHSWKKVPIAKLKGPNNEWIVEATYNGEYYCSSHGKRSVALQGLREKLKRASVRGIVCVWCNRGLRFYKDNPDALRSAAKYLEEFKQGSPFSGSEDQCSS